MGANNSFFNSLCKDMNPWWQHWDDKFYHGGAFMRKQQRLTKKGEKRKPRTALDFSYDVEFPGVLPCTFSVFIL